jgi:hypothetical protein
MTLRPVSNPAPIPEATLADVKATLDGLASGVYLSADLYARYQRVVRADGREPAHPVAFGQMLAEYGVLRCKRRGARAWRI